MALDHRPKAAGTTHGRGAQHALPRATGSPATLLYLEPPARPGVPQLLVAPAPRPRAGAAALELRGCPCTRMCTCAGSCYRSGSWTPQQDPRSPPGCSAAVTEGSSPRPPARSPRGKSGRCHQVLLRLSKPASPVRGLCKAAVGRGAASLRS